MLILKILLSCLYSFYLLKGRSCFSKIWSPGKNLHAAPFCFIRTLQAAFVLQEWCQIDPHYELIPIYHFQFCTFLVTEMSQNSGAAPAAGYSMFYIVVQFCHTFSIKIQFCELSEFKKQQVLIDYYPSMHCELVALGVDVCSW